jgi:hypothetical protein
VSLEPRPADEEAVIERRLGEAQEVRACSVDGDDVVDEPGLALRS